MFGVSLVPAAGAALSGLSNLLEDALQLGFAFWSFIAGTLLTMLGLIAFTLVLAIVCQGRRRLLAAVPAATLIGVLLFEREGGVIVAVAWLVAAVISLGPAAHTAARPAPTSP